MEVEKRKEVKLKVLKESAKDILPFYTHRTLRKIDGEQAQETADYKVKKGSASGPEHDSARHKALEKHIKSIFLHTQHPCLAW